MAIQIKSMDAIAEKWSRRASAASADYQAGTAAPRRDWAQATQAAEESYAQGIQTAIANKRFGKGVQKAGTAKWSRGVNEKGVARYGPGVSAAKEDYSTAFAPYAQVLSNITLPPKGPKGDPRNIARVERVATALHQKKMQS